MANKQMTDLAEVGRDLVDADNVMVNKTRSPLSRVYTYILAKLQAASSWIAIGNIANGLLTRAKLADASGQSVIGRTAAGTGAVADISASADDRVLARASSVLGFVQVTLAMIVNGTALSVLGRSANSAGVYGNIAAANDGEVLRRSGTTLGFGKIGYLSLLAWPAASASRAAAQSIGTGTTPIVVDLDTSDFATGGSDAPTVSLAGNTITVVRAGIYRLTGRVGYIPASGVAVGAQLNVGVRVNSTVIANNAVPAILSAPTVFQVTVLASLAANDVVDLTTFQNTGNSQNTVGSSAPANAQLQVEYVGPAT
jgi:hypothetical protein